MPEPRLIACLIYPDVMSLDVTGPLQVFASVARSACAIRCC